MRYGPIKHFTDKGGSSLFSFLFSMLSWSEVKSKKLRRNIERVNGQ